MVLFKVTLLPLFLLFSVVFAENPREKRTVDLFLRGVGDVFGYDVIRRVPSPLLLRQVATSPRPTFFPPAVGPLPSGSYSRIILQLQRQQEQQKQQEELNFIPGSQPAQPPLGVPQGAILLPVASILPALQTPQSAPQPSAAPQAVAPPPPPAPPAPAAPAAPKVENPQVSRQTVATTAKPEAQQVAVPWQIVALAPFVGQQNAQQNQGVASPPAQAQAPAPAAPSQPQASLQQSPEGLNLTFDSGPTRVNLFGSPQAAAIRRTFNLNLNWNRNVEPAALVQDPSQPASAPNPPPPPTLPPQQQPQQQQPQQQQPQQQQPQQQPQQQQPQQQQPQQQQPQQQQPQQQQPQQQQPQQQPQQQQPQQQPPQQQSAALVNFQEPVTPGSQIENFEVVPMNDNRNRKQNMRKLNANFRQSVKKFWDSSPWNEDFKSEDGKEQDNAQNYFEDVEHKPRSEDIQEGDNQSEENESKSTEEQQSEEVQTEESRIAEESENPRRNYRRKYTKVKKSILPVKREKKSPEYTVDDEDKQVKGYYKKFLVRNTRSTSKESYEPVGSYSSDGYDVHDRYDRDFSFEMPESKLVKHSMEKFDVEADIPKTSKVRTKESKKGFNIVKIKKTTKVIKE